MYTVRVFWLRFRMGHISDAWSCSGKFCLSHCNNWLHTNQKLSKVVAKIILKTMPVLVIIMHQSIPPAPSPPPPPPPLATAGHLPALSVPGMGHLQMLHCPGAGHLPTPRSIPSFWHARGFLSEYNYKEGITGRKADWLICQGQEQIVEGCNGMFSILHVCMHFFIAYQARIT